MDASLTTEILALIDRCKLEPDDPKCLGTFEVLERIENLLQSENNHHAPTAQPLGDSPCSAFSVGDRVYIPAWEDHGNVVGIEQGVDDDDNPCTLFRVDVCPPLRPMLFQACELRKLNNPLQPSEGLAGSDGSTSAT